LKKQIGLVWFWFYKPETEKPNQTQTRKKPSQIKKKPSQTGKKQSQNRAKPV
jgi:hypothetical protein